MSWSQVKLGEVADIVSGSTPKSSIPELWDGEILWATPTDLSGLNSKFISSTQRTISKIGLKSCSARLLPKNSVLFSSRAPIGLVAINTEPMATNQGFKSFVPNENVDPNYLYWWLRANRQRLQDLGNGATFKEVSKAVVSRVDFPLPPFKEQRRIASILDNADAICRKREQALGLADGLLKAIFLEMFGDPNINPHGYPLRPLKDHADVKIGYPFQSSRYSEQGVRLCRGANTLPSRLDWSDVRYWPVGEQIEYSQFRLAEGDVILALDRPWISSGLKVAQVKNADLPALLVQRVARIRGSSRAISDFIYLALNHKSFWAYCKPTETTIPHISPVELREYLLIDPGSKKIERFGERVTSIVTLITKLSQELKWSNDIFGSISQRAFSGEL